MTSLQIFLWFTLVVQGLSVLSRLFLLVHKSYPRVTMWSKGEDALAILIGLPIIVWAWSLLP